MVETAAGTRSSTSRSFSALPQGLSEWILDATSSMGYTRMTPVQASTIPLFLGNKDVVVEAVTGSGKTLSFLIPVIEKLMKVDEPIRKHHVGAIVISPTRELATQIYNVLLSLLNFHGPSSAAERPPTSTHPDSSQMVDDEDEDDKENSPAYPASTPKIVPQLLIGGSLPPALDIQNFLTYSPNLLIGTPGRLLELLSSPHVHCPQSSFQMLILDEADRLLSLGFQNTLQRILSCLPKQRRTGLFSASVSDAVDELVKVGLRNPVKVTVKAKSLSKAGVAGGQGRVDGGTDLRVPSTLETTYLLTPPRHKLPALVHILEHLHPQQTLVYVSTHQMAAYLSSILTPLLPSYKILTLHSHLPPHARTRNLSLFTSSSATKPTILLSTDLAARGLDFQDSPLVIQLSPPTDPATYIHRIGRTARAGASGLAILFLMPGREEEYLHFLSVRNTPTIPLDSVSTRPPAFAPTDTELSHFEGKLRSTVLADRALHDRAQRAFVSYIRFYTKHMARSIFRVSDLDFTGLARALALLKMPRMPELQNSTSQSHLGFETEPMDWQTYKYKDKKLERARLNSTTNASVAPLKPGTTRADKTAWSATHAQQARRSQRREDRHKRKERARRAAMTDDQRRRDDELHELIDVVRARVQAKGTVEEEEFNGFD